MMSTRDTSCVFFFSFLFPPRPPTSPLFPYTTLFRSGAPETRVDRAMDGASRNDATRHRHAVWPVPAGGRSLRSEEHTSELQSHSDLVCRLLLEKKKKKEEHGIRQTNSARVGR